MEIHKLSVTTDVSGDGSETLDYEVFGFCLTIGLDYAATAAAGTDVTVSISDPEGPARTLLTVTDNNGDGWYAPTDADTPFKGELKVVVAQGGATVTDCVAVTFFTDDRVSVGAGALDSPADGTYIGNIKFGESLPAGTNNIGDVDVLSLPAGNLGQRAMSASLSIVPANDITDGTYVGTVKVASSGIASGAIASGAMVAGSQVDGHSATLGLTTAAAASSTVAEDTTARVSISLWKGIKNILVLLNAKFAALGQTDMAGSMPVTIANNQSAVPVNTELAAAAALAEGMTNPTTPPVGANSMLFNGTTWDRELGNTATVGLASALRTASFTTDVVNYNARGALITLNVTARAGASSIHLEVWVSDLASSQYETYLVGGAVAATGRHSYLVYPGCGVAANAVDTVADFPLPRNWAVAMIHANGDDITYSVGVNYIL